MDQPRLSLNVLHVPSPCTVPWKSMTGTEQVRFCDQCRENVYNLSAMTAGEANALLARSETPCVRFYRRLDGTVVTSDRCGNRAMRAWRSAVGALSALLFSLGGLTGCDERFGCTQGKPLPPARTTTTATAATTTTATPAGNTTAATPKGP
jgi:hypothetical protein